MSDLSGRDLRMSHKFIVNDAAKLIKAGDVEGLRKFVEEINAKNYAYNIGDALQTCFMNSCSYGKKEIFDLLYGYYSDHLDEVTKIGFRSPGFIGYCKTLIKRHPDISLEIIEKLEKMAKGEELLTIN